MKLSLIKTLHITLALISVFITTDVFAEPEDSIAHPKITSITVIGAMKIDRQSIINHSGLQINQPFSHETATQAIKKLYATSLYADAKVSLQNNNAIIQVKENPIIVGISLSQNEEIQEVTLRQSLKLIRIGDTYSHNQAVNQAKILQSVYQARGFHNAKIIPKISYIDSDRINLIFEVNEGAVAKIQRIQFIGNHNINDETLRSTISSREHVWYRFFSTNSAFSQKNIALDEALLSNKYKNAGYANFKITNTIVEYSDKYKGFMVTYIMDEGKPYTFGNIKLNNVLNTNNVNAQNIDDTLNAELQQQILVSSDDNFNATKIEQSMERIKNKAISKGMPFTNVTRTIDLDHINQKAHVTFHVTKSTPVYIRNIIIRNNTKTMDKIIRRELKIQEGNPYNKDDILLSQTKLERLDYFSEVAFDHLAAEQPDEIDLEIKVKEKSTGKLNLNLQFDQKNKIAVNCKLAEENFGGTGKAMHLSFKNGSRESDIGFHITDEYFLNRNILFGIGVNHSKDIPYQTEKQRRSKTQRRYTTSDSFFARIGYKISDNLTHIIKYSAAFNDSKINENISPFISKHERKYVTSGVSQQLIYNTLNRASHPSYGTRASIAQNLAVLFGSNKYIKHTGTIDKYHPLTDKLTLQLSASAGHVFGVGGSKIRKEDAFSLGMDEVCGFAQDGIGPRDKITQDSLGGKTFYSSAARLEFPLKRESGLYGLIFLEGASAYGVDSPDKSIDKDRIHDEDFFRISVGAGIVWDSPVGSMTVQFGIPLRKTQYDKTANPRFVGGN